RVWIQTPFCPGFFSCRRRWSSSSSTRPLTGSSITSFTPIHQHLCHYSKPARVRTTGSPGRSESRFHQLFQDQDARLAACRRGLCPDSESRWSCRSVLAGSLHRPARQRRAQRCWLGPLSCSIQRRRWLLVTSLHFSALWPWCGFCSTCTSGWSPLGDRKSVVE